MDPESVPILLGLLAAHVCGDAFIYSRLVSGLKRADRVSSRMLATAIHCFFHAVFVFVFLLFVPVHTRLWACLYVFAAHFLIDFSRVFVERKIYPPEDIIIFSKKDVLRFALGRAGDSVNDFFGKNMKTWMGMNLLDQSLHLVSMIVFVFGILPHLS